MSPGLLAMLVLSATYNLWPVSRAKWVLRRFDHSAIYLLIAATYTPFIAEIEGQLFRDRASDRGVVRRDHRHRAEAGFCRAGSTGSRSGFISAMGWSGVMLYDAVVKALPTLAMWFVVAGGVLYTLGVIFHAWRRLRFQNAIWHCFVLLGAACHYTAVLDLVLGELGRINY